MHGDRPESWRIGRLIPLEQLIISLSAAVVLMFVAAADASGAFSVSRDPNPDPLQGHVPARILQTGIYGTVTDDGLPAVGVALSLMKNDGNFTQVATTSTSSGGDYDFTGVPSLQPDELYFVQFGPNNSDSSRLFYWYGPDIVEYTAGTAVHGGTFDIADVVLQSPADGASLPLPVGFSWSLRGSPSDSYTWFLLDQAAGRRWYSPPLGYVATYTLDTLPSGFEYGTQYRWHLSVFAPENGFGLSYGIRDITFTGGTAPTSSATPTASGTSTTSVTPTQPVASATPSPTHTTITPTATHSQTPSHTPTTGFSTPSHTPTASGTGTVLTPSATATSSPTASPTRTATATGTTSGPPTPATPSSTASAVATATDASSTPGGSVTPATGTPTTPATNVSPTATSEATPSPSGSVPVLRHRIYLPFAVHHSAGTVMNSVSS